MHGLRTLSLAALLALAPLASADLIVGQVVDTNGVGVAGVDIDVKNLGSGGTPTIFNDGTDANGFFATTVPAGFYDVIFNPPPPPTTTHLIKTVPDVVIVGTVDMGVIVLDPGVSVSGRVVTSTGLPVVNGNIDVIDLAGGDLLDTGADTTDVLGNFNVAVSAIPIDFRIDATGVPLMTLASTAFELAPTGDLALGDIVLAPGFAVTGTLHEPSGAALANVDLDFLDSTTGVALYTPKDNTDVLGNFNVVVPAGTFDVEICPNPGLGFVAHTSFGVVVAAPTALGVITLQQGFLLTGIITAFDGTPVQGADVDVDDPVTGQPVTLCNDNAGPTGAYSVLVPLGTFDVKFDPPGYSLPLGASTVQGVAIGGATVLNGVLPSCPFPVNYGAGGAGSGGFVPHVTWSGGASRVGNPSFAIELQSGLGGAPAVLIAGFGAGSLPVLGGTLLINVFSPILTFPLVLGGPAGVPGAGAATFPLPIKTSFLGVNLYCQQAVIDPGAASGTGFAFSDGMHATFCD